MSTGIVPDQIELATEFSQIASIPSRIGQPAWELARLFPVQGRWTEAEYLALDPNHRIELCDGVLEFLPVPTFSHHDLLQFLFLKLLDHVSSRKLGRVYVNGVKVRLWDGNIREPDVVYLREERISDRTKPSAGADLTMEIVSGSHDDRKRDLVEKREHYAKSGVPEYWIVDPELETITVLILVGTEYQTHGVFKPGQMATSILLPGFEIDVKACFDAGRGELPPET